MDDAIGVGPSHGEGSRSRGRLAWLALGIVALVVFELTADPALVVVIGCLKFGWDELATARWLRRVDPNRVRGRVVSLFFAAWSLARVTAVAFALIFITVLVLAPLQQEMRARGKNVPDVPAEFKTAGLLALAGIAATSLTAWMAIVSASRTRIKAWVGREGMIARRMGSWPPVSLAGRGALFNRARWVVMFAVLSILFPAAFAALISSFASFGWLGPHVPRWLLTILMIATELTLIVGAALLTLRASSRILAGVVASSPEECWLPPDLVNGLEPPG